MHNVMIALFNEESVTYQAFSQLKARQDQVQHQAMVLEAVVVQKAKGALDVKDSYRWDGQDSGDTWIAGGVIGALVGVLGGPVGMLVGSSLGMLMGTVMDTDDAAEDVAEADGVIEKIASTMQDGHLALIAIADEPDTGELDSFFAQYTGVQIVRRSVATVQSEIYQAQEAEAQLRDQARAKMREEKKAEWHEKAAEVEGKIKAEFEKLKSKL